MMNEKNHKLIERWNSREKKRILCLDGGGIRGALTLGFLEKIESILRKQHNNEKLLLCDYFDLIAGTSTGSIIAAGLSIGMSVCEIRDKYLELGEKIFNKKRKSWLPDMGIGLRYFLSANYDEQPLEKALQETFRKKELNEKEKEKEKYHHYTLGDEEIKTGLCIVTKRADTFSTWPLINNPKAKYYDDNKGILLWELVRASSAAPTYFRPKQLHVGKGEIGVFIDGGVSSANNPALMTFLVVTLKGFRFDWGIGKDNMMIVSVGTGFKREKTNDSMAIINKRGLLWGNAAIDMFMADATYLNQMMLQYFSDSDTAVEIDSEVGDEKMDLLHNTEAFTYIRYNAPIEKNELNEIGMNFSDMEIKELIKMDNGKNAKLLYEIGQKNAEVQVKDGHFPNEFSIKK